MSELSRLYREIIGLEIELWEGIGARLKAECDLPLSSFEILHLLRSRSGARIQDIADEFSITGGGTSKVVDRLEAAGWCGRRTGSGRERGSRYSRGRRQQPEPAAA